MTSSANPKLYFLWLYTRKLVVIRYRGAYLGLIWNILQPLIYLLIIGFVFATFNNAPLKEYIVYLFAGLVPWRFFEQAVMSMLDSISLHSSYIKKMKVPFWYFPIVQLGVAFVDFCCAFSALFVLFLIFQPVWHIEMLILPLSILVWLTLAGGAGMIGATAFVFFQDLKNIVQMLMMLLLFTSTIFFKADLFHNDAAKLLFFKYDPVCYWVNLFQKPIYYGILPDTGDWLVSLVSSLFLCLVGVYLFQRHKDRFYYYL